uniref:Uncharacterized protein n=1 Tax=Oryza meridionalis TaxID=40149 RepID=A0A0E0DY55_9ORYZ
MDEQVAKDHAKYGINGSPGKTSGPRRRPSRMEADGGCSLPRFAMDASHIWRRRAAVADGAFSRSESEEEWKRIAADG